MAMVSVIIPAYNCEKYVGEAMDSVLAQGFSGAVDVIAIDDGSTDGTHAVLERYAGKIRIIRQGNAGVSVARNAGLDVATGEYVAFLDSDDVWFREKLGVQVKVLEMFPSIAGVFSNFQTIDQDGNVLERDGIKKLYSIFRTQGERLESLFRERTSIELDAHGSNKADLYFGNIFKSLFKGNFINMSSMVVRRKALDGMRFNPGQRTQEDYDLWMRLSKEHPLAYIDAPLLYTRKRPGQLTGLGQIEEIAVKSLEIVERYSSETGLLGAATIKRRLAGKYRNLGEIYLRNSRSPLARAAFIKSLGYEPCSLRSILCFMLSLAPSGVLNAVQRRARPALAGRKAAGRT